MTSVDTKGLVNQMDLRVGDYLACELDTSTNIVSMNKASFAVESSGEGDGDE